MPIHRRSRSAGAVGAGPSGQSSAGSSSQGTRRPRQTTPRYLTGIGGEAADPLLIQRQEETALPEVPRFQLTPPSLLQPRDPYARFYPDFGNQLHLDPDLELRMLSIGRGLLSPPSVLAGVAPIAPVVAVPGVAPSTSGTTTPGPLAPTTTPAAPPPTTAPPVATSPTPPSTATPTPEGPRPGGGGDVLGAVMGLPQVSLLLEDVQNQFTTDFSRYWNSASTGEQVGFVSSSVVVGGAILAPLLGFEEPRNFVLPLLNDVVLPVPGLSGYGLEFRFGEHDVMIGAHLDVGRLLPSIWGFGEASFSPIGGPPGSDPSAVPPVSRMADGEASGVAPASVAAGIRGRAGKGSPLDDELQSDVARGIGDDFSQVRIHTDAAADDLARSVHAHAFTTGHDIFFRAGRFDPESRSGRQLLAHELVHVAQRTTAPPAARGGPLTIVSPGDRSEQEAERVSNDLMDGESPSSVTPGPTGGKAALHRQPEPGRGNAPKAAGGAKPVPAAVAKKAAPPPWTDYFDEVVPAVLEAAASNQKVGLERAMWLITQAYGEQSPGVAGPPSRHRNRLFNEQAAVEMENGKVKRVLPGQESEGVYLFNLSQNESPTRDRKDMKTSPTFGYDTPERAAHHHVEQLQERWGGAWNSLTAPDGSFEGFARGLKAAGYAKAADYDTALIALQGQVKSQVAAWIRFRLPEMRARVPQMEEYLSFLRSQRALAAQRLSDEPDPVGHLQAELAHYDGLVQGMELQLADVQARKDRLERFAGVLGVKVK